MDYSRYGGSGADAGGASRDTQSPSLAVRLMQVAGEYELERKRERQRLEISMNQLKEVNEALERKVQTNQQQVELLTRKLAEANFDLEHRATAGDEVVDALTRELIAVKFELARKSRLLQQAHEAAKLAHISLPAVEDENADPQVAMVRLSRSPSSKHGQALSLAQPDLPTAEELLQASEQGLDEMVAEMLTPKCTRGHILTQILGLALLRCAAKGHVAVAKRLLAIGADIETRSIDDELARTPLHVAASNGREDMVRLLMGSNANLDPDDVDGIGATALHLAARNNHGHVVKYLLLNGASPDVMDGDNKTALDLAKAHDGFAAVRVLSDKNMLFWNASVRANKFYNDKRFGDAIDAYSLALTLAPQCSMSTSSRDLATLHYNRARAAYRMGRHCQAVEDCSAALEHDSTYRNALAQRAECFMSLFDFSRAVQDFQGLLDADPSDRQWARRLQDAKTMRDMTHYQVLCIAKTAAADALKKAYRQQCLKWHPDKHQRCEEDKTRATTAFRRINEAYEHLNDSYKRMVYDMELSASQTTATAGDGFDKWLARERERESERESERLRALAELEQRQIARSTARTAAIALARQALHSRTPLRRTGGVTPGKARVPLAAEPLEVVEPAPAPVVHPDPQDVPAPLRGGVRTRLAFEATEASAAGAAAGVTKPAVEVKPGLVSERQQMFMEHAARQRQAAEAEHARLHAKEERRAAPKRPTSLGIPASEPSAPAPPVPQEVPTQTAALHTSPRITSPGSVRTSPNLPRGTPEVVHSVPQASPLPAASPADIAYKQATLRAQQLERQQRQIEREIELELGYQKTGAHDRSHAAQDDSFDDSHADDAVESDDNVEDDEDAGIGADGVGDAEVGVDDNVDILGAEDLDDMSNVEDDDEGVIDDDDDEEAAGSDDGENGLSSSKLGLDFSDDILGDDDDGPSAFTTPAWVTAEPATSPTSAGDAVMQEAEELFRRVRERMARQQASAAAHSSAGAATASSGPHVSTSSIYT